jgi:uncharacterized protein (DUF433 family)
MVDWREHIHSVPGILHGRPVIKGTRIKVEFILKLLSGGWSEDRILEEYDHLTADDIRAAVAFAHDMLVEEEFVAIHKASAA